MPYDRITLTGALPGLKEQDAERIAVYLVRGNEILARSPVQAEGHVHINLDRQAIATPSAYSLDVVIGPAGLEQHLDDVPNLQRVPLQLEKIEKGAAEMRLPLDNIRLSDEILESWWLWCRWYCVNGTVLGPDGCPVPGAQVTVYTVAWSGGGYTKTPRATVTTDASGHFNACFSWCTCFFCWPCWPCWPFWWLCWPWWWEWDILHVIEHLERAMPLQGVQGFSNILDQNRLPLKRPESADLMVGQGFSLARKSDMILAPDQVRTNLIQRKLADPRIRAIFPWWWWCCDNPNIAFSVTQNANTIVDEDPATDTRWCLADGSTVTLIGNQQTISACTGDPKPATGFVWTRVGNITVDHISDGYADGNPATDTSDLAFAGKLDIYGEFAPGSGVSYYQVEAGQWSGASSHGNPSRGGTPPASSAPISADLFNTVIILHVGGTVTITDVKMGPFPQGGLTNLYATQEQRPSMPGGLLPPFPTVNPGDVVLWAYNGRKVNTNASALIGGGSVGGVTLTIIGYDASFSPVALPSNLDDSLTLDIDNTGLSIAHINSLRAFQADNTEVTSTGSNGDCPAYHIGAGGYVQLNVTVQDSNGHLFEYEISADFGHGSTGTTTPGLRGYRTSADPFPALPYVAPNVAQKSFEGGTEIITFYPTVDCCYDFRLYVGKRVTDGTHFPVLHTADFQTATLKVT